MARITWDNSPAMMASERSWAQEMFNKNTMPGWVGAAQIGADLWGMSQQKQQASAVRKFQRQMSNTAHVRQVRDMRAAGLNPILSAGGSGATTPGGAQAQLQGIRNPLTAGIQAAQGVASAKLTEEQAQMAKVSADRKKAAYDLVQRSPGGPIVNAMLDIAPNSKTAQAAAGIAMGLGNPKLKEVAVSSGKKANKVIKKKVSDYKEKRDVNQVDKDYDYHVLGDLYGPGKEIPTGDISSGGGYGDRQY